MNLGLLMADKKNLCAALVMLLCAAPITWAGQNSTGSIGGTVTDESGGVMPGVTVSAAGDDGTRSE
jgi:hypothetical protein